VARRGRPTWVRVLDPPDGDPEEGFALALSDEEDGLLGWVATPDCQAVGLVATGRLRAFPGAPAGAVDPDRDRLRIACLVMRDGEVAWKVAGPDGTTASPASAEPPSEGRMLDCLRRCFALPTPPPPVSPGRLQAIVWLAAVLDRATRAHRRLSWTDVARLHPVAQVLRTDLASDRRPEPIPGLLRMAGSAWTWEDFHRLSQGHSGLEEIVDPALAAWMDEGMFARWVLSELPSAEELLAAVRQHLAPSAARRLTDAVHASDLPEPTGAAM
jgi:hypothetical protein